MPRAKRPAENPAQTPTRVPKHGRGRLRIGGTNKGGPGRPPEALRMASREVFAQWLAWAAKQMADPDQLDPATLNVIGNTAAKYGLGTTTDATLEMSGPAGAPVQVSIVHEVIDPRAP